MRMLRAEQNESCIFFDFHRMDRRPVEQVTCAGGFLRPAPALHILAAA
jgi:hypothetical protein